MTTQVPLFDTHRTIEQLMASGGFEKKQAEAIAEAVNAGLNGGVATSSQLEAVESRLDKRISELETRLVKQGVVALFVTGGIIAGLIAYATSLILAAIAG